MNRDLAQKPENPSPSLIKEDPQELPVVNPCLNFINVTFNEFIKADPNMLGYVSIHKDQFLNDMRKFLYNYCTSG